MVQRKNSLYDTASIQGRLAQEALDASTEGKSLPRSKMQQRKGLSWNQTTYDAGAMLRTINLATGREMDAQGAHFHIWDAKGTSDIVLRLRAFILGMEQALTKTENKHREKMRRELLAPAQAEINRIWNETGVDYNNTEGDWEPCLDPFDSCPKVLKARKSDTPKK